MPTWDFTADDSIDKMITVYPNEGHCFLQTTSLVYPASLYPGQSATVGIAFINNGYGTDNFRILFTFTDPVTNTVVASADIVTGLTGIAVNGQKTVSGQLTLPASYATGSVKLSVYGFHDVVGF